MIGSLRIDTWIGHSAIGISKLSMNMRNGDVSLLPNCHIGIGKIKSKYYSSEGATTYYISGTNVDLKSGSSNNNYALGLQTNKAGLTEEMGYAIVF